MFGSFQIHHNHARNDRIPLDVIEELRTHPSDEFLENLAGLGWFLSSSISDADVLTTAEKIVNGTVDIPGCPDAPDVSIPFDYRDLGEGPQYWRLFLARLGIPQILLRAYTISRSDEFLFLARDIILELASFEKSAWKSIGKLWNEHAICTRTQVMAVFWRLYRNHPNFDPEVARQLLQFVSRGGSLLARRTAFIYNTNHGMFQNLGLWHLSLAFPALPRTKTYCETAYARFRDQMGFYLSSEGVILEHSTLYHKFGIELLHRAFAYCELLNRPVPEVWKERIESARKFYIQLRRPDGSIPVFGDSWSQGENPNPWMTGPIDSDEFSLALRCVADAKPTPTVDVFPTSGYAVWWNNLESWPDQESMSQVAMTWSYFPGHAHKHADELAISLWAAGQTWWTNVGNWPVEKKGRADAMSWSGSNAPHRKGEEYGSKRAATLKYFGSNANLVVIDAERIVLNGFSVRRQVINLRPDIWVVIDSARGCGEEGVETVWTSPHNVEINRDDGLGSYNLSVAGGQASVTKFFLGSADLRISEVRGSYSPFAGWETDRFDIVAASALIVTQPCQDSWTATICACSNRGDAALSFREKPRMKAWNGPTDWQLTLPLERDELELRRDKRDLRVCQNGRILSTISVAQGPDTADDIGRLRSALEFIKRKYPNKRWKRICAGRGLSDALTFVRVKAASLR